MKDILELLYSNNIDVKESFYDASSILTIIINSDSLLKTVQLFKELNCFDMLLSVSGVDYNDYLEVVYLFINSETTQKVALKVRVDSNSPKIPSITDIFPAADWNEREIFDLLGVHFTNHPNLKRILLPEDWIGHPLRKNYVMSDKRLVWNERK